MAEKMKVSNRFLTKLAEVNVKWPRERLWCVSCADAHRAKFDSAFRDGRRAIDEATHDR